MTKVIYDTKEAIEFRTGGISLLLLILSVIGLATNIGGHREITTTNNVPCYDKNNNLIQNVVCSDETRNYTRNNIVDTMLWTILGLSTLFICISINTLNYLNSLPKYKR